MLSKKNRKQYDLKHANGRQHFSLRKTTLGLASVLLSTTLYLGTNTVITHAAETNGQSSRESSTSSSVASSQADSTAGSSTSSQESSSSSTSNQTLVAPAKTQVVDANNLTDSEKAAVISAIKAVNSDVKSVIVDNDGTAHVTLSDGQTVKTLNSSETIEVVSSSSTSQNVASSASNESSNSSTTNESANELTSENVAQEDRASNDAVPATNSNATNQTNIDINNVDAKKFNWYTTTDKTGIVITKYMGNDSTVVIPNTYDFKVAGKLNTATRVSITWDAIRQIANNTNTHTIVFSRNTDGSSLGKIALTIDDYKKLSAETVAKELTYDTSAGLWVGAFSPYSVVKVPNGKIAIQQDTSKTNTWLTAIDASSLDTSGVTDTTFMFSGLKNLQTLNVSGWNTSQVKDMTAMFYGDESLTNLDVSSWNTANVTSMAGMFQNNFALKSLDVSGWNTGNVTNMRNMFRATLSLSNLDVSKWNTANVTDMSGMFWDAPGIYRLVDTGRTGSQTSNNLMYTTSDNFKNWNVSKVTNFQYMFGLSDSSPFVKQNVSGKQVLTYMDLSSWNVSQNSDKTYMFQFDGSDDLNHYLGLVIKTPAGSPLLALGYDGMNRSNFVNYTVTKDPKDYSDTSAFTKQIQYTPNIPYVNSSGTLSQFITEMLRFYSKYSNGLVNNEIDPQSDSGSTGLTSAGLTKDASYTSDEDYIYQMLLADKEVVTNVDFSKLKAAVDDQEATHESDAYKNASAEKQKAYDAAVDAGKQVLANDLAYQTDVDTATTNINNAKALLSQNVDKSALQKAVDTYPSLTKTAYDSSSKDVQAAFDAALQNGKTVLADPNATQQQVDDAKGALDNAALNMPSGELVTNKAAGSAEGVYGSKQSNLSDNDYYVVSIPVNIVTADGKPYTFSSSDTTGFAVRGVTKLGTGTVIAGKSLSGVTIPSTGLKFNFFAYTAKGTRDLAYALQNDNITVSNDSTGTSGFLAVTSFNTQYGNTKYVTITVYKRPNAVTTDIQKNTNISDAAAFAKKYVSNYDEVSSSVTKWSWSTQPSTSTTGQQQGYLVATVNGSANSWTTGTSDISVPVTLNVTDVSKDALQKAVDEQTSTQATPAYYNADSTKQKAYDDAVAAGKTVLANTNATQQQVDDATKAIETAKGNLDGKETNKADLQTSIANANTAKSNGTYDQSSSDKKSALDQALADAETVNNKQNATQSEVDQAKAALDQAIANLDGLNNAKTNANTAIDNMQNLNDAQKTAAKNAVSAAQTVADVTTAQNNAQTTDNNMKSLSDDDNLNVDTTKDPYLNADSDLKTAYDNAKKAADAVLNKTTGESVGASEDPKHVQDIKDALDNAASALNGATKLNEAKTQAGTDLSGLTKLNNAQRKTAQDAIENAKTVADVTAAVDNAKSTNTNMGDLADDENYANADNIKQSSNYKNADTDKQKAYDDAVQAAQDLLDKSKGTSTGNVITDPDAVQAAKQKVDDAFSALNGDNKLTAAKNNAKEAIGNLQNINDAQKSSAISAVENAQSIDDVTTAKTNAQTTDTNMKSLHDDTNLNLDITADPYLNADQTLKDAYNAAKKAADAVLAKSTGESVGASEDPKHVQDIKDALDKAAGALNGTTKLSEAKSNAASDLSGLTNLNNAQMQTAKKAVANAKAVDDVKAAVNAAKNTNTNMGTLAADENYTDADQIKSSVNFTNADADKQKAYTDALEKVKTLLDKQNGSSTNDVTTDAEAVQAAQTELDNAAAALNGQTKFNADKQKALDDFDANYPNLNNAQKATAKKRISDATSPAELTSAQSTNSDLNTKMGQLKDVAATVSNTKSTDNYNYADPALKSAYDTTAGKVSATVDPSGDDLNSDQVTALINQEATDKAALNGEARKAAKEALQSAHDNGESGKTTDPKYYNATDTPKANYDKALTDAESTLSNDNATLADYQNAKTAIDDAYKALDGVATNKQELQSRVSDADNVRSSSDYKNASDDARKTYEDAIKAGQDVLDNTNATQVEVNTARDNIDKAKQALATSANAAQGKVNSNVTPTPVGDKTNLTSEEQDSIKKAVEDANKDNDVKSVTVDPKSGAATVEFNDGSKATIPASKTTTDTDKTRLKNDLDDSKTDATKAIHDKASTATKEAYDKAVSAGQTVFDNDKASQKDIDEAAEAIETAKKAMEDSANAAQSNVNTNIDKTAVGNKDALTTDEQAAVKKAVEKGNPGTTVSVDDKGTATVTFDDGSKATIAPEYTVKGTDKSSLVKELNNEDAVKNTQTVTLSDSEDKTPIQIYQRASDEARKAYDDAIAKGKEVNQNTTATQDEIDAATKAIQDAVKGLTSSATDARLNFDFSFDKTPVADPSNVSDTEKQTILANVKSKNSNVDTTKSVVNADGSATIVLTDGSSVTLTPAQTIKDVNKDELRQDIATADKLQADTTNYNKASDEARSNLEAALADAKEKEAGKFSQADVDTSDVNLKKAISALQTSINSATANNPSVKTPVGRGRDVNDDESAAIKAAVNDANPGNKGVVVNSDGSATVTLANGGQVTIPASATTQDTNKTALKTAIDNGKAAISSSDFTNASTTAQDELKKAVQDGQSVFDNAGSSQKQIDDAASAINTALDKVTKSINAAKGKVITDITKTPVGDKANLTDDEKQSVAENVKKAVEAKTPGENVTVDVNNDGSATVTFNDGSKAIVPATDTVTDTDKSKLKAALDEAPTVESGSDFTNASTETQTNYKQAVEAGQKVFDNQTSTQKAIDDATEAINNAKAALADSAKSAADKLDVNVVKTQVGNKSVLTDVEKQSVKENVTDAIKAKTPDAEFDVSVDGTGNATVTFKDGSKGVISSDKTVTDVDKTGLQNDVNEKSSVEKTPAYYNASDDAQKEYNDAIDAGQAVLDNPTATKDDVDKARAAIAKAKEALTGNATDKTDLESSIDLANEFKDAGDTYNNASDAQRKALDDALAEANKQDQDPNATQSDVNKAQQALDDAFSAISGDNDASNAHSPAKTPVPAAHKNALTSEEEAAIEQAIKNANDGKVKSVIVDPLTAEANVIFNDGSKKTYTANETIKDVDKSELQTQKDLADSAKDTSSYFNASDDKKTAFDKALADAETILSGNKKDIASQTDVDNAKSALEQAISNLNGKATDKKPLEESIALAKDLQNTDVYNNASDAQRESLSEALSEAEGQDADPSATQTDVDAAKAKLDQALDAFSGETDASNVKKPAKTPVPAAHKTALTDDEISAVKSAITSANSNVKNVDVDAKGNASILFNDGSKASLNASDTITDVDKTALQTSDEAAQGLKNSSSYYNASADKKQVFNDALAKADSILNGQEKDTATQGEIDDATQKLNDAARALDGKATDKTGLEDSITVADAAKDLDTYQMASDKQKSDLETALKTAKDVDADENASQESVDNAKKALDAALDAINNSQARDTKAPETKTEIHNPDSFSQDEQQAIHGQVQNANPDATDIKVDDQGNATVTYGDGSHTVIKGEENVKDTAMVDPLINTGDADAELNSFSKTPVQDPDKLTDSEKQQVVSNIKTANSDKHIADVDVKDNGRTIITFEDGTQKELDRSQTISYPEYSMGDALTTADEGNSAQAEQSLNSFDKVAVQDPDALTNTEKQQVVSNIKTANSDKHIADVDVKDNGRTIVTFEDGTQKELDRSQTISYPEYSMGDALTTADEGNSAQAEQSLNSFDKVAVQDPDKLTDSEKNQVAENIKNANSDKHIADVEVKDNGRTIITFEDGTQKELDRSETITYPDHTSGEALTFNDAQADQSLNNFDKVEVQDPDNLTDIEKNQVAENIKTANSDKHIADVEVKNDGRTIITFEDGTQKELTPAQTIVEKPTETPVTPASVNKDDLKKEVAKKDQIHTSVAYANGSAVNKKAYDDALAKAEAVLADENASQEDVDAALAGLVSASQKLDGKESVPTSTEKDDTYNETSKSNNPSKLSVTTISKVTSSKKALGKKLGTNADKLPQTGSHESEASVIGLGLLTLALAVLGIKKKKDEE